VPQQNVDLLRKSNAAFRRGDWDAWGANFDPDILVRTDPIWPEQRIYGRQAVLYWGRGIWESLGSDVRLDEIEDLGDRVLARARWVTQGQHSGVEGELVWSELLTVREGRVVFIEMFPDHEQALKAVGLKG
jgi:ketosteroid isomerase-like protein